MIKHMLVVLCLLLLCSGCVSRTVRSADSLSGSKRNVITEKKLIWFWQDEFRQ